MARKNAPTSSPRPQRRPRRMAPPPPRPGTEPPGLHGYGGPGTGRLNAEEERTTRPKRMKSGGMCRGMGKASRGGRYGKSG